MRRFCAGRVEWKYIDQLEEAIEDKNLRNYVSNQVEWYVIKAGRYRILEYTLKFLTVVMPTLVVIVQRCLDENNLVAQIIVLGGATITSASGTFLKLHEKRVLYRKSAELIKEETSLFINHAAPYDQEESGKCFVMRLHEISADANSMWGEIEEKRERKSHKAPLPDGETGL